jgi:hypothetical protein
MTPEQLEKAARHLCKLRGIDPDQQVAHGAEPDSACVSIGNPCS